MGFRDLESFNLALLAKQCWRIQNNPKALWVRILKARYFNHCKFFQAKIGSRSSWAWSSILAGRETISLGARWQVNNGKSIQVWEDRWVPNIPDGMLHPLPTSNRFTPLFANEIIKEDTHSWRTDHIDSFIPNSEVIAINNIVIGDANVDDRMIWPMEKSGKYTVRSGYHFLHNPIATIPKSSSSHGINKKVWSIIWGIDTLPKIKHFLWRVLTNSLPTGLNLYRRKLLKSPICSICGEFEESVEHCILLCAWTECTWFGSSLGLLIPKQAITTFDAWLIALANMKLPTSCTKQDLLSLFAFVAWNIWKGRCEAVYKSTPPTPSQTINTVRRQCLEFKQARCGVAKPTHTIPTPANAAWAPLLDPLIKINVDGAWDSTSKVAGAGVIIRGQNGNFIAGSATISSTSSVIEAEAAALVKGMKLAVQLNLDNVVLESDSQELINALDNHIERGNWRIYPFLTEFHRLRAALCNVSWRWISRQANRAADTAAKLAKSRLSTDVWVNRPPTCLIDVLTSDGLPSPH
ncbi:hypothetical protein M0R45_037446 [Rubus argutus]|uniref:Uncharacterized protein n=1 Tax=Rubus argutus TaxID=59490 RepID=A0AAW1W0L9_RUBAR